MHSEGFNSALSPVVYVDIAPSINTLYSTMSSARFCRIYILGKMHMGWLIIKCTLARYEVFV